MLTAFHHRARVDRLLRYRPGVRAADRRQLGGRAGAAVRRRRLPGQDPVARLAADANRTQGIGGARAGPVLLGTRPTPKAPGTSACSRESIWICARTGPTGPRRATTPSTRSCCPGRASSRSRPTSSTCPGTPPTLRVLVAFRDGTSSTWRFLDLRRGPGRTGAVPPVSGTQIEYFMQAVDASGNVAVSTNKGLLFSAARRRRRAGRASSRRSPGQRSPAGSSSRRSWTSKRWRASLCRCRLTTARSRPSQAR